MGSLTMVLLQIFYRKCANKKNFYNSSTIILFDFYVSVGAYFLALRGACTSVLDFINKIIII